MGQLAPEKEWQNPVLPRVQDVNPLCTEDNTEKVYEAQRFIMAYEQWLKDHPKKDPPRAMKERYEDERKFIASQYSWTA